MSLTGDATGVGTGAGRVSVMRPVSRSGRGDVGGGLVGTGCSGSTARPCTADAPLAFGEDGPCALDADETKAVGRVLDVVTARLIADRDQDRGVGRLGPGEGPGRLVQGAGVDDHQLGIVEQRGDRRGHAVGVDRVGVAGDAVRQDTQRPEHARGGR